MAHFIYMALAGIAGFVTYLTALRAFRILEKSSVLFQIERQLVTSTLFLGVLGTYVGFYIGTVDGLTPASATLAIATAVPTSIAGVTSWLILALVITLRERKSYE